MIEKKGTRVRLLAETEITDEGGQTQYMKHAGFGYLRLEGDSFELSYEDRQGEETIGIRLLGNEEEARMERTGSVRGMLVFRPGETVISEYETEYGVIRMAVHAEKVVCETKADVSQSTESEQVVGESVLRDDVKSEQQEGRTGETNLSREAGGDSCPDAKQTERMENPTEGRIGMEYRFGMEGMPMDRARYTCRWKR